VVNNKLPEDYIEALKNKFPNIKVDEKQHITVPVVDFISFMTELQEHSDYSMNYLTNLTATDYDDGFELIYNLVSLAHGYTLMVKVKLPGRENPEIPSLSSLWGGAIWQEREVYDLMGINFTGFPGHPTRILLDDDFEGYPLRKDFQWEGGQRE
jgi:NADH-quinone oxidoreductase subunit C